VFKLSWHPPTFTLEPVQGGVGITINWFLQSPSLFFLLPPIINQMKLPSPSSDPILSKFNSYTSWTMLEMDVAQTAPTTSQARPGEEMVAEDSPSQLSSEELSTFYLTGWRLYLTSAG
jgi:hypothetical protein